MELSTNTQAGDTTSALGVVEELARRFQSGALDAAFELYHPAVRIEQPASLPHGGIHTGRDGVRAMGATFAKYWSRTISAPTRMACDGDRVVQVTTQTWTAKATDRSATVDVVELFTIAGGQITEIRVFQHDTQRLLATLETSVPSPVRKPWPRSPDLRVVDDATIERLRRHWVDGCNNEDADTIVAPFAAGVSFSSPFVSRIGGDRTQSTICGLAAVRKYMADSFTRATRGIRYTADAAYAGPDTVALQYTVHHPTLGVRNGIDTMRLDAAGQVVEWRSYYDFER